MDDDAQRVSDETSTTGDAQAPQGCGIGSAVILVIVVLVIGSFVKTCASGDSDRVKCANQFKDSAVRDFDAAVDECVRIREAEG